MGAIGVNGFTQAPVDCVCMCVCVVGSLHGVILGKFNSAVGFYHRTGTWEFHGEIIRNYSPGYLKYYVNLGGADLQGSCLHNMSREDIVEDVFCSSLAQTFGCREMNFQCHVLYTFCIPVPAQETHS